MTAWLALIDPISRLLDRIIPDPEARDRAKLELLKEERAAELDQIRLAIQADQMQADINKQEAAHSSTFVAGWRPFIGWVCGVAFAYHFFLQPMAAFTLAAYGHDVKLPEFDMDTLYTVLLGMLGLGTMRSVEKVKGLTK